MKQRTIKKQRRRRWRAERQMVVGALGRHNRWENCVSSRWDIEVQVHCMFLIYGAW